MLDCWDTLFPGTISHRPIRIGPAGRIEGEVHVLGEVDRVKQRLLKCQMLHSLGREILSRR